MAKATKHVGKLKKNNSKVVVVFRTLPDEPESALVIPTSPLPQTYHDELVGFVDSEQAQQAFELGELLGVRRFSDGLVMLNALHQQRRMLKVATTEVIMTPDNHTENHIQLDELNKIIAEQKGVSVAELAINEKDASVKKTDPAKVDQEPVAETTTKDVLSDADLASQYRAQADTMYKEVQNLRKMANDLDPPTTAKKSSTKAKVNA